MFCFVMPLTLYSLNTFYFCPLFFFYLHSYWKLEGTKTILLFWNSCCSLSLKKYKNYFSAVTTHKTKPANKLSIDDTECISTIKVNEQIITVIGHVLTKFTHSSRRLMVVYIGASVLKHLRAAIILRFAQISITE